MGWWASIWARLGCRPGWWASTWETWGYRRGWSGCMPARLASRPDSWASRPGSSVSMPGSSESRPGSSGNRRGLWVNMPGSWESKPAKWASRPGLLASRPETLGCMPAMWANSLWHTHAYSQRKRPTTPTNNTTIYSSHQCKRSIVSQVISSIHTWGGWRVGGAGGAVARGGRRVSRGGGRIARGRGRISRAGGRVARRRTGARGEHVIAHGRKQRRACHWGHCIGRHEAYKQAQIVQYPRKKKGAD